MSWLESSAFANYLRGLGIWTYGLLNLGHILGISTLFGSMLVLDLKLMGLWRSIPVAHLIRPIVPLAVIGFMLAATSGIMMLSFNTTEYHGNPFIYAKFPIILAGLINVLVIQRLGPWRRAVSGATAEPGDQKMLKVFGAVSLLIWTGVVACGRLIGYW